MQYFKFVWKVKLFSLNRIQLKISSAEWQPCYLGISVWILQPHLPYVDGLTCDDMYWIAQWPSLVQKLAVSGLLSFGSRISYPQDRTDLLSRRCLEYDYFCTVVFNNNYNLHSYQILTNLKVLYDTKHCHICHDRLKDTCYRNLLFQYKVCPLLQCARIIE